MDRRIRVLIVDDQTLIREGFRKLLELEPDFEVVDTANNGEVALATATRLHQAGTAPDVILMDIRMPHMDGITATRAFKERWPTSHIVILTTFDDIELIQAGLRAGAIGYLLKDTSAETLASTVRVAARGEVLLQPEIANKVFSSLVPSTSSRPVPTSPNYGQSTVYTRPAEGDPEPLTEREQEILALVARGASNRQIAEELFLAEGTIKNYISSILGKMGVRDRTQAALKARERGLV